MTTILETQRMLLRNYTYADLDEVAAMLADEELGPGVAATGATDSR